MRERRGRGSDYWRGQSLSRPPQSYYWVGHVPLVPYGCDAHGCQTKLEIFSRYVPAQFNFELKIYNFTDAFLSGTIDRLCTSHIREWLEFPPSSCVTEWASSPTIY